MPPAKTDPRWKLYSCGLILLFSFFQIMQWPLLPRFLDIYYHIGVMKGFADAGGYVTRAFWENAPAGRPHLYPPLLHVWMWMLYALGLPAITVGRLVDCASYPLLLAAFYTALSRVYPPRLVFWALLLFASAFSAALASVTLSAFNLAFLLGLLALSETERDRSIWGGLLLALCFYAHTLAASAMLAAMALNAVLSPEKRTAYARAAGIGLLLALPFLAYQVHFRDYFGFVKVKENNRLELDVLLYTFAALSLTGLAMNRVFRKDPGARWALCLWLGMLPWVWTHQVRFFSGHGLAGAALLAALFVEPLFDKKRGILLAGALAALMLFVSPYAEWNLKTGEKGLVWADRTLNRYLWSDSERNFRSNAFTIYFQEPYEEIASVIRNHSDKDDILWTDFSYTAGILGTLSDRVTSCAMLAEMRPFEEADRLSDARVLVWFRDRDGQAVPEMHQSAERRGWKLLKETEMAFVFENPGGYRKRVLPTPLIPSFLLWPLGLLTLGIPLLGPLRRA